MTLLKDYISQLASRINPKGALWSKKHANHAKYSNVYQIDKTRIFYRIYKDFKNKTKRISSIDNVAAACLYLACRQELVPRTLIEICGATNSSKVAIGRSYKRILSSLEINVDQCINSFDYINRFTANLGLTFKTSKRARKILKEVNESDLAFGMSPISVSAAVVFMASALESNPRSVEKVSEVTGVSVTSIKNVQKRLKTRLK